MNSGQFVIVSGIPGTGKSTYCRWLQEERGFAHQDVDWQGLPTQERLQARPLVIDWGFPANEPSLTRCLEIIDTWRGLGAELWWFDGDRVGALESFLARATVSKGDWDNQLRGIEANWDRIASEVQGRVIQAIDQSGHKSNDAIYREMFPTSPVV